jgi:sialidase-1
LLNMRRAANVDEPYRLIATSSDGGLHWSPSTFDEALVDPRCQGSLIRTSQAVVYFANVGQPDQRRGLNVRTSFDEGRTWPVEQGLHAGPAAYSCLAALPDGRVACLYEGGTENPYEKLIFTYLPERYA